MRYTRKVALFLAVAIPFTALAQQAKNSESDSQTLDGTVTGLDGNNYWSGFKIESDGNVYTIVTKYKAGQGTNPTVVGGKCCEVGTRVTVTYVGSLTRSLLNVTRIVILDARREVPAMSQEGSVSLVPIPVKAVATLRQQAPHQMTAEENFYYRVAIYGYARTKTFGKPFDAEGYDNIDFYGETFDSDNYKRAMADEFERNRYRARIGAKIEEEIRKVNFNQKFTSIAYEKLGEYNFETHSFPFGYQNSVNGNQFASSLPMSESDASAFVKTRATTSGNINRNVKVRITYSVVNDKAGFSLLNAVYTPFFNYFIYSVEVFGDEDMTWKLGDVPRINSVPLTGEEWRLAKVGSLTATKEIGKYRYMPEEKPDGKIHNPLEQRPQMFGTIILTDIGITVSGEQPGGSPQPGRCNFYDSPAATLGRSNTKIRISWNESRDVFSVNGYGCNLQFDNQQERDRFFVDFTRAFQEWKNKYRDFQFASGKLTINWPCVRGQEAAPCADSTSSNEKPVWQTQTYKVTVESLEKTANKYIASLVFENLTNESIKIGWEEKSTLLPNTPGPYLVDDRGQKYFADGPDSANIITSSFVMLGRPAEISPKAKLTSRFVFSGSGDGKIFNLEARGIEWPVGKPITIEGLKVTSFSEEKSDSPEPATVPSSSVEPLSIAVLPSPESVVKDAFNAYRNGNTGGVNTLMSEQGMSNSDLYCQGAAINCLKSNYVGAGELKSINTREIAKSDSQVQIVFQTTWTGPRGENRLCQTYQLDMTKDGWRITFFDVPQSCSE